jgi:CHAT domain-containing protein/predicted negative regulator of RcsB-dependent stress response
LFAGVAWATVAEEAIQQARAEYRAGQLAEAIDHFGEAVDVYRQHGLKSEQALALSQQAEVYLALNQPDKALAALREALRLVEAEREEGARATILGSMGAAYLAAGRIEEAKGFLDQGVAAARETENHRTLAVSLNNLGNWYVYTKRYPEAIQRYLESAKHAEDSRHHLMAAKAFTNAARLALTHPLRHDPAALLASVERHSQQAEDSHDKALVLISLGQLFRRLPGALDPGTKGGHPQSAYNALFRALEISEGIGDPPARSSALGYLGALYEDQGRLPEALRLTARAQFIAQGSHLPELLFRWQWQTGRILRKQGDHSGAIAAYQRAVATLQPIRHELLVGNRTADRPFRESVGTVYFELADLLLKRHQASGKATPEFDDLLAARQTVELVKTAELEDYFQDDCVAVLQAKTQGIDRLAPKTAALYPIILPDRTELLLSLPDGMKLTTIPVGKARITEQVRQFRKTLEKRTTREFLPHAQALYRLLIGPLETDLKAQGIETLVIIPDDPLRTIPLAALHDGKEFLVQKYTLATTPGLTLTDPRPIRRSGARFLLGGLTKATQGFPPLPYVEEELRSVAGLYQSTVLENQAFRVPKVQEELNRVPFNVVHIASHGQFHSDIAQTFLLAYDGKIRMNTLERVMGMGRFRDQPVELLTLSACQTAAGDDRAALGLAGIAVKAGARSALASLWFINDRASALLVSEFYRQLRDPGLSKAEALRLAQIKLLEDKRYRHPGYWAPFLLIGNWL